MPERMPSCAAMMELLGRRCMGFGKGCALPLTKLVKRNASGNTGSRKWMMNINTEGAGKRFAAYMQNAAAWAE